MGSAAAVVSIVVAVITVIGTLGAVLVKNSRSSPESRDAQTNAWGQINDRLNKHLDWLTTRVTTLDDEVESLRTEITESRQAVTWLRSRVQQLTDFIRSTGGTPPDPPTPEPGA